MELRPLIIQMYGMEFHHADEIRWALRRIGPSKHRAEILKCVSEPVKRLAEADFSIWKDAREDLKTGNLSGYTTPVSATTQASPPVVDYTGLFLGMSFQGLQLTGNVRPYTGGGWVDIIGTDNVYGMTLPRYPASPWGGTATAQESLQLIYNSPTDQSRQIVTDTTVPPGVSNKAIQFTFHNPYIAPTQETFQVFNPPKVLRRECFISRNGCGCNPISPPGEALITFG